MHALKMSKRRNIALHVSLAVNFLVVIFFMTSNDHVPIDTSEEPRNKDPSIRKGFRFRSRSTGFVGRNFSMGVDGLQHLQIPPKQFPEGTDKDLAANFVFVTYASSGYFRSLTDTILAIQRLKSPKNVVVYDIGLTQGQADHVRTWCMVKYRKFDFTKYPSHVSDLHTYAFKAMIWKEAFLEFDAAFFIDATVHMNAESFTEILERAVQSRGFVLLSGTGHSTFAATNPQVYTYFPVDLNVLRRVEQLEADVFIINNEFMYWGVLHWLYMCALDEQCISPPDSKRFCSFTKDRFLGYGACHRYDQSVLNLLAVDLYGFDNNIWRYPNTDERVFGVRRGAEVSYQDVIDKCE